MEDFYETRISEVDGQMVAFFGVYDGIFNLLIFCTCHMHVMEKCILFGI